MTQEDYTNLITYSNSIVSIWENCTLTTDYERKMWNHYKSVLQSVYALIKEYQLSLYNRA